MQHGEEDLPEFEEFLPPWITYLDDKTGHDADRLILEAVDLLNDLSLEIQCAEKYAAVHPGLYLNIGKRETYAGGVCYCGRRGTVFIGKVLFCRM